MKKIAFYRKIVFKVLITIVIILGLSFTTSYFMTTKYTNSLINSNTAKEFNNALNVIESFITFIGQTAQIWARHTVIDNELHEKIAKKDFRGLRELIWVDKNEISADSVILLDENGVILSQAGSNYDKGDSLNTQDIVKETFSSKSAVTKISRERESFIIYSSALIQKDNKVLGMILMGYFINDILLENIKISDDLEMAFVGNSAIMSSTNWGGSKELEQLPIDFIRYQSLLNNPNDFQTISYMDKNYIVSGKKLTNIDASVSGSILIGLSTKSIETAKNDIFNKTLLLLGSIFFITLIALLYLTNKLIWSINILKDSTLQIASGDLSSRVNVNTNDEFEILANNFNKMIDSIELKNKQLNDYTSHLEEEVEKRTDKLIENEKVLFQQAKMASLGEMIGNIAHQWRQPLSVISTAASGMKLKHEFGEFEEKEFKDTMDMIMKKTQHLSSTIDDFRNFFNESKEKTEFNLKALLLSSLDLVIPSIKENKIELINNIHTDIHITGYKRELMQSIINILNNAIDVLIDKKENTDKYIFIETKIENSKTAVITIKDSGGGIDKDIIDKIFEPYFTTKHQSQGTGLGLHMSYQIICDNMKGSIKAKNVTFFHNQEILTGAQFIIKLPLK